QWTLRQVEHVIDDAGIAVLFVDERAARRLARSETLRRLRAVVSVDPAAAEPPFLAWNRMEGDHPPANPRAIDRDVAALVYTSGSTGAPKGVMVTHQNLIEGTRRVDGYLEHRAADRLLGLLPMSAPWGVIQITSMVMEGGAVVLQPVPLPDEIVQAIARHSVTGMAAMPATWIQMVAYLRDRPTPLPSLRYITSSGGAIPRAVLEALPALFPAAKIYLTYGLTEAFRSTYLPPELYRAKMGSLGKPCRNVDIFVIRAGEGVCGPNEEGELVHRGSVVTAGYWRDPRATAE